VVVKAIRFVYGLCSGSKIQAAGKTLCPAMNLPKPPTRFQHKNNLDEKIKECIINSMSEA